MPTAQNRGVYLIAATADVLSALARLALARTRLRSGQFRVRSESNDANMSRSQRNWLKLGFGVAAGAAGAYILYKLLARASADAPTVSASGSVGGPLNMWLVDENAVEKAKAAPPAAPQAPTFMDYTSPGRKMLVLYGTEYGTSKRIADKLAELLVKQHGMQPRVVNMSDFKQLDLTQETAALIVVSTYGDGVPPTEARDFYDWLHTADAPSLKHLRYSLLALGDSNYPEFCKCGRTMEKRLLELGAQCILKRAESDQENWDVIDRWIGAAAQAVSRLEDIPVTDTDYLATRMASAGPATGFGRQRPYLATLAGKRSLTVMSRADDKETVHYDIDLGDSGLTYFPGDALGIYPINAAEDVAAVLKALGLPGSTPAQYPTWHYKIDTQKPAGQVTLQDVLSECYDLKTVKPELLKLMAEHAKVAQERDTLGALLAEGSSLARNKSLEKYIAPREVIDVLEEFTARPPLDLFLSHLGRLLPRYYSISSSQRTDAKRVTVTAAIVRYETLGRKRKGVCTTYLEDRLTVGSKLAVFVNNNPDFRMPPSVETPMIMVGPGTGLAPFRAFLQERKFQGDKSPALLFFGCRSAKQDFLYSDELQTYARQHGLVLHTAFSRDQGHKVYVQQRLWEARETVWRLLAAGAHFYVCGDAAHMAGDVHAVLLRIHQECGGMSAEQAAAAVAQLEHAHRYQKDVWF